MEASYCKSKAVPEDVDENHGRVEDDDCQPQVLKFVSINFGTLKKCAGPHKKERLILEQAKQEGVFCRLGQEARSNQVQYQRHGWICLFGPCVRGQLGCSEMIRMQMAVAKAKGKISS